MPGPLDPAYRARLAALNDKFAAGLPDTLSRLGALRAALDPAAPDAAAASRLYKILHTLAGSAATFGHPLLGDEARRLEEGLRTLDGEAGWAAWLARLDGFIAWAGRDPQRAPQPA